MRYFFSTGEASGELNATLLAAEIAALDPDAQFAGIGAERMREFGFDVWACTRGWSSILPFSVLLRIPRVYAAWLMTLRHLLRRPPAVIVLVDFGAFNLRLASALRRRNYRGSIVYLFPPGAWFDKPDQARAVARWTVPVAGFEHQYDFYRSLGLRVRYFGHPLRSRYEMRAARAAPPGDAGTVALLPGSRAAELRHHVPLLLDALSALRRSRPALEAFAVAADGEGEATLTRAIRARKAPVRVVRGTRDALTNADAAWIASGTAVLEAALLGCPAIAFYRMSKFQVRVVRYLYRGRYIALPNLIANREIVPELAQEAATCSALAEAMDALLLDPGPQYAALQEIRAALGPSDALARIADFVVQSGKG